MCVCVETLRPSMCEENNLIEISLYEERQIMYFYDRLTLTDNYSEYIKTPDSLLVLSVLD